MTDVLFGGPAEPSPEDDRQPTRLRVLITVKAAPNPSAAYGETVCVAGLRLDPGAEGWVRLYPINFRFIEQDLTFRKYDVVTVDAKPASEGRRESWRPQISTLQREGHLDGWPSRMPHLLPFTGDTMCDLNSRATEGGRSLGLVRARQVQRLAVEAHPGWSQDERQKINDYISQPDLFEEGKPKTALEAPRYKASYHWRCTADGCKGHKQGLIDWEFTAFQRRLPADDSEARAAIVQRWFTEMCRADNDVYFYVGNQAKRHHVFSVLGVAYPRR